MIGDSLTAGSGSTTDANARWPDVLSDRLRHTYGIANQGIAATASCVTARSPWAA